MGIASIDNCISHMREIFHHVRRAAFEKEADQTETSETTRLVIPRVDLPSSPPTSAHPDTRSLLTPISIDGYPTRQQSSPGGTWQNRSYGSTLNSNESTGDGTLSRTPTRDYLNGGYWPSWKHHEGVFPSCVPLETLTHVNYAFADIDGNGTVYLADERVHYEALIDGANGCLRAWTQRRIQNTNLKIILAIGGGQEGVASAFAKVAASRAKRYRFTESAKLLIDQFELDGIDIDWEYPTGNGEDKQYLQLLTELRKALGWHRWITTAMPAGRWVLEKLDLHQIAKVVDFINLMAYDFVGPTFANVYRTGHHARLYANGKSDGKSSRACGSEAVDFMLERGVPAQKIMFGIPAYGRCFKGAIAPDESFVGPGSGNDATYEVKDLPRPGMVEKFDCCAVGAYACGNGEFITYDNKESVSKKAQFVQQKNLRGLFYWHLAGDRRDDASLVKSGYEALSTRDIACRAY